MGMRGSGEQPARTSQTHTFYVATFGFHRMTLSNNRNMSNITRFPWPTL